MKTTLFAWHQPLQTYPTTRPVAFFQEAYAKAFVFAPLALANIGPYL